MLYHKMEKKSDKFNKLPTLNKVAWWIVFFQDEILDYTVMTEWRKFNQITNRWLDFFYDKTVKSKSEKQSEKLIVNIE